MELEPTLERRYLAAKAAWRLDDLPAVGREMEAVREEAEHGSATDRLEGRALTALADVTLMREADLRARRASSPSRRSRVVDPTDPRPGSTRSVSAGMRRGGGPT